MSGIFISYRRQDSEDITGRIRERLAGAFGGSSVFKDTQSIPQGSEFPVILAERINDASAALIIIGPSWLSIAEKGRQRLFEPKDYVRAEVEAALSNPSLLVLPVLVRNAKMPQRDELPKSIASLADRNAIVVRSDPDFDHDIAELIDSLLRVMPTVSGTSASRVVEFDERENVDYSSVRYMLKQRALRQGRFEVVIVNLANDLKQIVTFDAPIVWPRVAEAMWQACRHVDPNTERVLGHLNVSMFSSSRAELEVLFSSTRFRVKCRYGYQSSYSYTDIKGTMIIDARESRTVDAVQQAYKAERAKTK